MKKPTITPQDAARVIAQIAWLCNTTLTHIPQKQPLAFQTHNPFEMFEDEFARSKLTLAEMAKWCNMCPSTFKRKFIQQYGISPHKWQVKQRLNRAAEMLFTTELLVKQVAYECGFVTPSHFIRCFKKEFCCTPEEYRRLHL